MGGAPGYPARAPLPQGSAVLSEGDPLGWQPSRFLADRVEAERAFALAERLGSVNAAAAKLGTTWPSLRKAFTRHGLGMPARNPQAVRQRAMEAARQRRGRPPPAWTRRSWPSIAASCPSGPAQVGSWPSGCAAPRTMRPSAPRSWWSCTAKATRPRPAPAPGRSPAALSAPIGWPASAPAAPSTATLPASTAATAPADPSDPRDGEWLLMPADPTPLRGAIDAGGQVVLGAHPYQWSWAWRPTPAHENVAWSPGDVGFAWCS
jgi:hypothetical protein